MRKLAFTTALQAFILDLLYLSARLDANEATRSFAAPVQKMLASLEATAQRLFEAQKAVVLAQAVRDHRDDSLDETLKRSGKMAEAVYGKQQSPEFRRAFPAAPSTLANLSWEEEIAQVAVVAGQLEASGDPMLVPLAAPLRTKAAELQTALEAFKATFTPLAAVRADRDFQKVETNVLREKVYGQLLATFPGERRRVEKFFRDADAREAKAQEPADDGDEPV